MYTGKPECNLPMKNQKSLTENQVNRKRSFQAPTSIQLNNNIITDKSRILEYFAQYFANISSKLPIRITDLQALLQHKSFNLNFESINLESYNQLRGLKDVINKSKPSAIIPDNFTSHF